MPLNGDVHGARTEAAKALLSLMLAVSVGFWANELKDHISDWYNNNGTDPTAASTNAASEVANPPVTEGQEKKEEVRYFLILLSGVLFLADILCIAWWYANYIYRIQPVSTFENYFLDFLICSMFALGANSWREPVPFLAAGALGSVLLFFRFFTLYRSPSASQRDREILRLGLSALILALLVALAAIGIVVGWYPWGFPKELYPGLLAAIGVGLTIGLRSKIEVATDVAASGFSRGDALPLIWPDTAHLSLTARNKIRSRADAGLEDFFKMFARNGQVKMRSRVHPETDLLVQSYILGVSSIDPANRYADEINHKAFMVGASHWLDDLVDGRSELDVWRILKETPLTTSLGDIELRRILRRIYERPVRRHLGFKWDPFLSQLEQCCSLAINHRLMYQGLIRVAYGAVMFSPRLDEYERERALNQHNSFLTDWNQEHDKFETDVEKLLDELSGDDIGKQLLGLSTKTVLELAMSSEKAQLDVSLSILLSIMYTPLLYYHDLFEEIAMSELLPVGHLECDYDRWLGWLRRAREILDSIKSVAESPSESTNGTAHVDERIEARRVQLEMGFLCFQDRLPARIQDAVRPIYMMQNA